jgi:ATP-binding protein involved in chromosome partitioning
MSENKKGIGQVKNILVVASGKGGVGKSTIAVNLARVLYSLGLKIGILDADIYGPSLFQMLPPQKFPEEVDGVLQPATSEGMKSMSIAFFGDVDAANAVRAPIANAMIDTFLHKTAWGELDALIIDLPPGTGDIPLTIMQSVPIKGAILVTTPQEVSIIDVKKAFEMCNRMKVPVLGIIENMSYYQDPLSLEKHILFGFGGGKALSEEYTIPLLGEVPLDPFICKMHDRGESIFSNPLNSSSKQILMKIGIELREQICDPVGEEKTFVEVERKDQASFQIQWANGNKTLHTYKEVQKGCPCARCIDSVTGISIVDVERLDPHVTAHQIDRIGNYGLRFQFSSGCTQGIYSWQQLLMQ